MDNLSHSLAGAVAGEFIHRSLPKEKDPKQNSLRRRLLLATSILANSFPDLDLVLTPLLPPPLGYLLHHRGHTHTILYSIPQALLLFAMIWVCWPSARRLLKSSRTARKSFIITLFTGFILHLTMDYLNSYGIHPFHPFNSDWFYGDMIFIVEPFFWVTFGVPMIMMISNRFIQWPLLTLLLGVPLYFTINEFLSWGSLAALSGVALLLGLVQQRTQQRRIVLILSGVIALAFIAIQSFASHKATKFLITALNTKDSKSRFHDSPLTPFPTHPLCWMFVTVESNEQNKTYRLRRGILSLAPGVVSVTQCPSRFIENEAPLETASSILYFFEETGDLNRLRQLKNNDCHFQAWLRFIRAPSVHSDKASDIRYSRSGQKENFTTMYFEDFKNRECPKYVPQWNFPRADLLN